MFGNLMKLGNIQIRHCFNDFLLYRMNQTFEELGNKKDLQSFLTGILKYLQSYFQTAAVCSEEKTYSMLLKITRRLQKGFPNCHSISTLSQKVMLNVKQRILEKLEDQDNKEEVEARKKQHQEGFKGFFQLIENGDDDIDDLQLHEEKSKESEESSTATAWIRKVLIEEISHLIEDFADEELSIQESLQNILQSSSQKTTNIVFFDSYLNNMTILKAYDHISLQVVALPGSGEGKKLEDASRLIRKSDYVVISAETVFKNGDVLGRSGALMLAVAAKAYSKPLIAVTRGFCLVDRITFGQKSLVNHDNLATHFDLDSDAPFQVCIAKKHDLIERQYVNYIVSEKGLWNPENITEMFKSYFS